MSDHIQQTIRDVQGQVQDLEAELLRKKKMVNDLAELAGLGEVYAIASEETPTLGSIRRDQWYGQPLATAIREYLEMRRVSNHGPSTVNEIYDALISGGYEFDAKDSANAKRGLRISLTKNTSIFHRLPDKKHYGLLDWYPDVKEKKGKARAAESQQPDSDPADENEGGDNGDDDQ